MLGHKQYCNFAKCDDAKHRIDGNRQNDANECWKNTFNTISFSSASSPYPYTG